MQRRVVWYKRHLFKNHFMSYKDWDQFNPPSDFKHPMRYKSDAILCRNADCPRDGRPISEHEAYYYFAKRRFLKKFKLQIVSIFRSRKVEKDKGNCYICPFCGGMDVEELASQGFFKDPRVRIRKR